jgi:hypothetical protein
LTGCEEKADRSINRQIFWLAFPRLRLRSPTIDNQEPFGFSFLQIIGSVILVGVVGIALIDQWITDFAHLL